MGSSPRVWGQVATSPLLVALCGIIPTRVGTRQGKYGRNCRSEDHPHACGDKVTAAFLIISPAGSSPRVWGQGHAVSVIGVPFRIIPTRVGTRPFISCMPLAVKDHPHACGDKFNAVGELCENAGIIPTRVGTSCACYYSWVIIGDHPHACGDKELAAQSGALWVGSSPRVWGQDRTIKQTNGLLRIIPTRVGTSCIKRFHSGVNWDHPHACGDKFLVGDGMNVMEGSSPRVWGQVLQLCYKTA